eukprot:303874-Pyramimonas_sp.AAC.1
MACRWYAATVHTSPQSGPGWIRTSGRAPAGNRVHSLQGGAHGPNVDALEKVSEIVLGCDSPWVIQGDYPSRMETTEDPRRPPEPPRASDADLVPKGDPRNEAPAGRVIDFFV